METRIITITNNKGGVGKTTSVAALGDVLARKMGKNVLLIDADPQGNLSRLFGYGVMSSIKTTFDVFLQNEFNVKRDGRPQSELFDPKIFFNAAVRKRPTSKRITHYDNLRIVCSTPNLQAVYKTFENSPNISSLIFKKFLFGLKKAGEFDYVLIDTNPSFLYVLGQLLVGSDYLMIPITPLEDAIDGAERIINEFKIAAEAKQDYEFNRIDFLGFFFCNTSQRKTRDKAYRQKKGEIWDEGLFFDSYVPPSDCVWNASNKGGPVTSICPSSLVSAGYYSLAKEMERRIKESEEGADSGDR